jgi:uncharacterized protein (TIGR02453 family)
MSHISKKTIKFLKDLAKNNNRDWFKEHKKEYTEAKENFESFITAVHAALEGPYELDFVNPKDSIHRIYRNLRFSKDKTPYKTSMSANISSSGKKGLVSGIYIHIDPTKGCFVGGGVWHPETPTLQAIREEILQHGDKLEALLAEKMLKKYYGEMQGEKLKTSPRGYDAEHQYIEYLRHKGLTLGHSYTMKEVQSEKFIDELFKAAIIIKPFLDFLKKAMRHRPTQRK